MEGPFVEQRRRCEPGEVKNADFWRFFRAEILEMRLLCLETSDLTRTSGISLIFNSAFKPCVQLRMPKNEVVHSNLADAQSRQLGLLFYKANNQHCDTIMLWCDLISYDYLCIYDMIYMFMYIFADVIVMMICCSTADSHVHSNVWSTFRCPFHRWDQQWLTPPLTPLQ